MLHAIRLTLQPHMQVKEHLSEEEKIKRTCQYGLIAERWFYEFLQQQGIEATTMFAIYSFNTPWLRAYIDHKPSNKKYCISTILRETTTEDPHSQNWQLTATDLDTHFDSYRSNKEFAELKTLMDIVQRLTYLTINADKLMRKAEELLQEKGVEVMSTRMQFRAHHKNLFMELTTNRGCLIYHSSYGHNGNWRLQGQVERTTLENSVKKLLM